MMMAGAFLGWAGRIVAFFISVLPALVFGILQLFIRGDRPMPFGPSLAGARYHLGVLALDRRRPRTGMFFFEPLALGSWPSRVPLDCSSSAGCCDWPGGRTIPSPSPSPSPNSNPSPTADPRAPASPPSQEGNP